MLFKILFHHKKIMPRKISLFPRMGGKFNIRKNIVDLFPPTYTTFAECFVGSGQVFLELEQQPHIQYVINDLDTDIYDIWNDLKSINRHDVLQYDFTGDKTIFDRLKCSHPTEPSLRLFRNLYLSFYSYSGLRNQYTPKPYKKGASLLTNLSFFQDKLQHTTILNLDYKDVIKTYDSPTTLFYLDPPYTNKQHYYNDMAISPTELAEVCSSIQGFFVLSYDMSPEVQQAFQQFHFHKISMTYTSGVKSKKQDEYIITNYKFK